MLRRAVWGVLSSRACSSQAEAVNITPACVQRLKRVATQGERLRVMVDGGGCSGFEYKFSLEPPGAPGQPDDQVFTKDGVSVVIDKLSLDYMRGASVDYTEELIKSAFKISSNPLAEKGCSCGASFALKMD